MLNLYYRIREIARKKFHACTINIRESHHVILQRVGNLIPSITSGLQRFAAIGQTHAHVHAREFQRSLTDSYIASSTNLLSRAIYRDLELLVHMHVHEHIQNILL